MPIISFSGLRKSGKSSCANNLIDIAYAKYGLIVRDCSFAETLREEFSALTGVSMEILKSPTLKEEFRDQMILFGQQKRSKDPKYFVNALFNSIDENEYITIDDSRFLNELEAVMKRGGVPYKVEADRRVREDRGFEYDPVIDESQSETELGTISADTFRALGGGVIYNNGSIESLRRELEIILRQHFIKL